MLKAFSHFSAEQIVQFIARDYLELSAEKVHDQRDFYVSICRQYMEKTLATRSTND